MHADVLGAPPISLVFKRFGRLIFLFLFLFFRRNIDTLSNSQRMIDSRAIRHYYYSDFFFRHVIKLLFFKLWSISKKEKKKTIRERGYSYSASRNNRLVELWITQQKKSEYLKPFAEK